MEQKTEWTDAQATMAAEDAAGIHPLAMIWQHKWTILLLTALGGGLGYLYYLRSPPVYQSSAQVLIVKKEPRLLVPSLEESPTYEDTVATHALLVRSRKIVAKAVEKHRLGSLPSFRDIDAPVGVIMAGLGTDNKVPVGANVFGLTYRGGNAADCATVLNAILQTYQDFLGETYQNFSDETVQLITQAKDVLLRQLSEKEGQYRKFRQDAPLLWKGTEGANLHETRMAETESARSKLLVESTQIKSRIGAIEAALKKGGNREVISLMIANSGGAGAAEAGGARLNPRAPLEEGLFSSLIEEQLLLEEFGPDHPKVKAVRKKLDLTRSHLGAMAPKDGGGGPSDFLAVYLESLRQDLKVQEEKLQGLNALFEKERESARAMAVFQVQDETYRNEISRTQQLFSAVVKRLDEINLVKDYGGVKTQVISPPGPGVRVEPKFANIMVVASLLGLVAGLGLVYVIEALDKRFRSPEEIRRYLGVPIVGHIPVIEAHRHDQPSTEGTTSALSPVLCVVHRPKGRQAEAYRVVRTALYFSTHAEGHKVIQITSPNPGDGKTTTAANLALSIVDSGKKVLLVDADFRRPRLHKYLAVANEIGLSAVIAGNAEVPEAIQQTCVPNLWVIPTGKRPSNPAELLTSVRFKELIDVLKDQYDFVIIDSPPVLVVTDPSVIAPRVDAVLMVVRLTKNARGTAIQATETLTSLGARIIGIVVNGLGRAAPYGYGGYSYRGYGYGYGKGYRYGYGRGYRYGYGQGYGYGYDYGYGYGKGDHVYYSDEKPQEGGNGSGSEKVGQGIKAGQE